MKKRVRKTKERKHQLPKRRDRGGGGGRGDLCNSF